MLKTKSKAQTSFEYIFIIAIVVSIAYTFLLTAAKELELSLALGSVRQSVNDYEAINNNRITIREINYTQPQDNRVILKIRAVMNETYSVDQNTSSGIQYYALIGLAEIFARQPFPTNTSTYYQSNLFNYTIQVS